MKLVKHHFLTLSYCLVSSLILVMAPNLVQAETNYVSDHLVITVRTGAGIEYQIIKTLGSGEHVEVLEKTEDGYSHIETSDGTEGWVRSQYLQSEPAANEKLITVNAKLKEVNATLKQLQKKYDSLNSTHKELSKNQAKLSSEKKKLDAEFSRISEVAKKPIMLEKDNRKLRVSNVNLEKDLQRLNQENHSLKDRSQREWFIVGALVLFGGIILGLVIPKLRSRKSSSW